MENNKRYTQKNGKVCYLDIPAIDLNTSVSFYREVFGWQIRERDNGTIAFDDTIGEVSGTWTQGRKPLSDPGIVIYIMVDDIEETVKMVNAHGGKIVKPIGMEAPEFTAHFADPAGNVLGLYQEPY